MGLEIPSPRHSQPPPTPRADIPMSGPMYHNSAESRQMPLPSHPLFQPALNNTFGPDSMHPGVFETMSTLEPLSVRVGAIHHESENHQSPFG